MNYFNFDIINEIGKQFILLDDKMKYTYYANLLITCHEYTDHKLLKELKVNHHIINHKDPK